MTSKIKKEKGITLISLVITIVVLIILAAVAVNMTIGDNGIFTKAKEAKKTQLISEAKEKIGTEILSAQMDAMERNEELEQTQIEDIVSKYGVLQEDGDTIVLNDNGYEVSLKDIYSGTITTGGSYTENKAKIELLEAQVETLKQQLESSEANKQTIYYIGEISNGQSLDVSSYSGYQNFTINNFLFNNITGYVQSEGTQYGNSGAAQMQFAHSCSYDNSTGKITFAGTYMNFNTYSWRGTGWLKAKVYLTIGTIN